MAIGATYYESEGRSVAVTLTAAVSNAQVAWVDGWLGIAGQNGGIGDTIALLVDRREFQFIVPPGLSVSQGDVVCVDTTQVTGHTPNSAAYNTSAASSTNIPLCKATADKTAAQVVAGILLSGM